jgi:hypothetical protein
MWVNTDKHSETNTNYLKLMRQLNLKSSQEDFIKLNTNVQQDLPVIAMSAEMVHFMTLSHLHNIRVYPKDSRLAAWNKNCKWYTSLPLGAAASLFCE